MRTRSGATWITLLLLLSTGCGEPTPDLQEYVDQRIEDEWIEDGASVDAMQFFAEGGHYYNHPDFPDATPLDEPHIVPLLVKLRDDFELEPLVILSEEPNVAYAVVMKLPEQGSQRRQAIEDWLNEADAQFPGMILQEWGYNWLSLDFLDEDEAEVVRPQWEGEE